MAISHESADAQSFLIWIFHMTPHLILWQHIASTFISDLIYDRDDVDVFDRTNMKTNYFNSCFASFYYNLSPKQFFFKCIQSPQM